MPKTIGNKIKFDFVILCDTIGYLEDIKDTLDSFTSFFYRRYQVNCFILFSFMGTFFKFSYFI